MRKITAALAAFLAVLFLASPATAAINTTPPPGAKPNGWNWHTTYTGTDASSTTLHLGNGEAKVYNGGGFSLAVSYVCSGQQNNCYWTGMNPSYKMTTNQVYGQIAVYNPNVFPYRACLVDATVRGSDTSSGFVFQPDLGSCFTYTQAYPESG